MTPSLWTFQTRLQFISVTFRASMNHKQYKKSYLKSQINLLLSPSSRRINHSLKEGWKNMYVLSSLFTNSPDSSWKSKPSRLETTDTGRFTRKYEIKMGLCKIC